MNQMKNKFLLLLFFLLFTLSCNTGKRSINSEVTHPQWALNAVIYELNVRQFTPEGTFKAAEEHLDRLKDLGVNIIWLMPISEIGVEARKGTLGSYYSVKDFKSVNHEFGNLEDFKHFVKIAHDKGLKVIIDWVANHTSRDAIWIQNKDWYVLDSLGFAKTPFDWTDVAELNYDNKDMREAMTDALIYWVKEADIDGYRCDVAAEVPTDFWESVIPKIKEIKSDIFMLAEAEKSELQIKAFNAYYAWNLHKNFNKLAQGKINADSLRSYFSNYYSEFPANTIPMNFTSNHDENSWNGTEFERLGNYVRQMAVLSFLTPGMPLIYNGQESGFNKRLEFFEKDSIDWKVDTTFTKFYKSLTSLKHNNKALSWPNGTTHKIISDGLTSEIFGIDFVNGENEVIGLFNFSADIVKLNTNSIGKIGEYFSLFEDAKFFIDKDSELIIPPFGFKVFYK